MPGAVTVLNQLGSPGPVAVGDKLGNIARVVPGHPELATPTKIHAGAVTALAFGGMDSLISAGGDMKIHWIDMETKKDLQPPVDLAGPVQKIDFARNDAEATFVTMDASVRQWHRGDEAPLTLRKPQRSRFVAMSVTGRCLVVQRDEGAALEVLSLAGHAASRMILHPGGPRARGSESPRTLCFAADNDLLLSVDGKGNAIGWNSTDAQLLNDTPWSLPALAMQTLPDGKIAAALADGSLVDATPDGRAQEDVFKPETPDTSKHWGTACISPDGRGAAWAETAAEPEPECEIRMFRRGESKTDTYRANRVSCIAYDAERQTLVLGLHNGTVRIIAIHGTRNQSYSWHLSKVTSLALSRDGTMLITGSSDGTIAMWDPIHGTPRSDYLRLGKPVRGVTLSGDGKRFAVATDESFMVGDVTTRSIIGPRLSFTGFGGALVLNQDGTRIAVTDSDGVTEVCQIAADSEAPPAWFNELASTFVARRFVSEGVLWTSENPNLGSLQQSLPNTASGPWNLFSRWLLDHPGARTISPWSRLTLGDYLDSVLARPGEIAIQERRKYAADVLSTRNNAEP
jgi:hypothetical protein